MKKLTLEERLIEIGENAQTQNEMCEKASEITEEIMPLRKKLKQAEQILEKSPHLYELLQKEHQAETNKIRKIERNR